VAAIRNPGSLSGFSRECGSRNYREAVSFNGLAVHRREPRAMKQDSHLEVNQRFASGATAS